MTTESGYALSLDELSSALATYAGPPRPRTRGARHRWMSRRLALALGLVALLIAGCSYAVGFDPFRGLAAADRPANAGDKLPPGLRSLVDRRMVLSTARFVRELPNGMRFYTIAMRNGTLCLGLTHVPTSLTPHAKLSGEFDCGYSLSPTKPITFLTLDNSYYRGNREMHGTEISYGLAWNGVTAITWSGMPGHRVVTTPVRSNVWVHLGSVGSLPEARVFLHRDDGSTQKLWPSNVGNTWTTHRPPCAPLAPGVGVPPGYSRKNWCYPPYPPYLTGVASRGQPPRRAGAGPRRRSRAAGRLGIPDQAPGASGRPR